MKLKKHLFIVAFIGLIFYVLGNYKKIEVDVSKAEASKKPSRTIASAKAPRKKLKRVVVTDEESPEYLTKEQHQVLCKFKKLHTSVPHRGDVQVFASRMTLKNSDMNIVWVKSPDCPEDHYSVVHFSDKGDMSVELSCTQSSITEIARFSGEQGDIDEVVPGGNAVDLAISGNGYFAMQCPNGSLMLTREGKFFKNKIGNLLNAESCVLLNTQGKKFDAFYDLNSKGCSDDGQCIGTLDPTFDDIEGLQYVNSYSFTATSAGPTKSSVTIFNNALERLNEHGRGLTSVNWQNHPHVNFDELECE